MRQRLREEHVPQAGYQPQRRAPAQVRDELTHPRVEERNVIERARELEPAELSRVNRLQQKMLPGEPSAETVLATWRSWQDRVGRQQTPEGLQRPNTTHQNMFGRAYEQARARELPDTFPMGREARPPRLEVPPEDQRERAHVESDRISREPLAADARSRELLRAEDRERWALAREYDRHLLSLKAEDPEFGTWADRQLNRLENHPDLQTAEAAERYLAKHDRATREADGGFREVAFSHACVASGLVRLRLEEERAKAAELRATSRDLARALTPQRRERFQAKLVDALRRPEFNDKTYCRIEAQRIAALEQKTSAEKERLVLLSAASNAPSTSYLVESWERDVQLGEGFEADPERAAQTQQSVQARDAQLREEAALHVVNERSDSLLEESVLVERAKLAMVEGFFERKQFEQPAAEKASLLQYIADKRRDFDTAPMGASRRQS